MVLTVLVTAGAAAAERPNVLVILVDDVGYSDLGAFGSEIRTPNLDELANEGLLLTNFHSGATCGPTRAMLMSGTDNHITGMGVQSASSVPEYQDDPHYLGYMSDRVVSLATLMSDAGYRTYMAGKWHLGGEPEQRPSARGFERSFALRAGGASRFSDAHDLFDDEATYWEDGEQVDALPDDFYSSEFYTDTMIDYIESGREHGRPFFGYLAYTALHWPVQVPDDWLDRYRGRYDDGWDALRGERLARMTKLGLVAEGVEVTPRLETVSAWEDLSSLGRQVEARKMELYAAMLENLDFHIGRVIAYLRESGQYENTFILFFSDNGPEGNNMGSMGDNPYWLPATFDNRLENMGRERSYVWMGPGWAQVSALPHRMYKAFVSEGGITVPAIVSWSGIEHKGARSDAFATVMDVLPTALELAGASHPGTSYEGREVAELRGRSLLAHLGGESDTVHGDAFINGWEAYGRRAFRSGNWKIVWLWDPYGPSRWELFNLADDPGETHDLSEAEPEKLAELLAGWDGYVESTGIVVLDRDEGYGRR